MNCKKIKILGLSLLFSGLAYSQTFVPTEPTPRVVVMEEFTGVNCRYCPEGHRMADQIRAKYPNRLVTINIHYSSLAKPYPDEPDFRTPYADNLASLLGVAGLPEASIDRALFPGHKKLSSGRFAWDSLVEQEIEVPTCVNIAAKTTVDYLTRELVCTVELYYTGDSPTSKNYLHIALLQNNIIASQNNGGANPSMLTEDGKKYRHNHMLRDFITGQAGELISTTTKGSFFTKTYRFTIPEEYGGQDFEIGNMDVVLFVTGADNTPVLNGAESELLVSNTPNDVRILQVAEAQASTCESVASVKTEIRNAGVARVDRLTFAATINGRADTLYWRSGELNAAGETERFIASGATGWCSMPAFDVTIGEETQVELQLIAVNDDPVTAQADFDSTKAALTIVKEVGQAVDIESISLVVNADQYASEVSWKLMHASTGAIVMQGAYEEDLDVAGTKAYEHTIAISASDCYLFEIYDAGGDGINSEYGEGSYQIYDDKGNLLAQGDGKYTDKDYKMLSLNAKVANENSDFALSSNSVASAFKVWPNPTYGSSTFSFVLNRSQNQVSLQVYDLNGRLLKNLYRGALSAGTHTFDCRLGEFAEGMYFLKMQSESVLHTEKISVIR